MTWKKYTARAAGWSSTRRLSMVRAIETWGMSTRAGRRAADLRDAIIMAMEDREVLSLYSPERGTS